MLRLALGPAGGLRLGHLNGHEDDLLIRDVTSTLAAAPGKLALEADLKVVCGYRGKKGHRAWRRIRVSAGLVTHRVGTCFSLCRQYHCNATYGRRALSIMHVWLPLKANVPY